MKKHTYLEKHKILIAKKNGFKTWNDLRASFSVKDCFVFLHEAANNAISELLDQLAIHELSEREEKKNAAIKKRSKLVKPFLNLDHEILKR